MRLADSLRAREPRASAHSIVLITGVSTVVLALLTTFGPNSVSSATQAASWAGVAALVHLSGLARRQVRAGDAVVGRLGGDELALLLPGCTAGTAARRARELVETVRASPLPRADGDALPLSISVGVAHAPLHAASVRELYAAADAALYQAKRAGRDRVEVAVSPVPGPADGLPRQGSAP